MLRSSDEEVAFVGESVWAPIVPKEFLGTLSDTPDLTTRGSVELLVAAGGYVKGYPISVCEVSRLSVVIATAEGRGID